MNSYTTNFLIILIYRFLVVCIMLPISFLNISLMHELINISFLVIHLVKRVIVFMILVHKKFFSLEMWFFTKIYSYFLHPCPKIKMTLLSYPLHPMTHYLYQNPIWPTIPIQPMIPRPKQLQTSPSLIRQLPPHIPLMWQ
jgi:hypothetical protein